MIQTDTLQRVLGMDPIHLHVFRPDEIQIFNKGIFPRRVNGELVLFIDCPIRKKEVQLDLEEYIRQLYTRRLLEAYKYPKDRLKFEYPISSDQETKRADIVVLGSDPQETPYIIVEIKKYGCWQVKHNSVPIAMRRVLPSVYGRMANRCSVIAVSRLIIFKKLRIYPTQSSPLRMFSANRLPLKI